MSFTPDMKIGKVVWCKRMLRKRACFWVYVVFLDEVYFSIKATTSEELFKKKS